MDLLLMIVEKLTTLLSRDDIPSDVKKIINEIINDYILEKKISDQIKEIIDIAPIQIFAKDDKGRFIMANKRVSNVLGIDNDKLIGKTDEKKVFTNDKEVLKTGKELTIPEETISNNTGKKLIVRTTKIPMKTINGKSAVLTVSFDITDLKSLQNIIEDLKKKEENYHAMLSHFINNDLQAIISNLELLQIRYERENDLQTFNKTMKNVFLLAKRSSRNIERVTKIFEILKFHSSFEPNQRMNIMNTIEDSINHSIKDTMTKELPKVSINNLDLDIWADDFFCDIFKEILFYIITSRNNYFNNSNGIMISGYRKNDSSLELTIEDYKSATIPKNTCKILEDDITSDWEYHGHYIGISLASVILKHYKGNLVIEPKEPCGNKFVLSFPASMIVSKQLT